MEFAWHVLAARLTPRQVQSLWHLGHQFSLMGTLAWRWDLLMWIHFRKSVPKSLK